MCKKLAALPPATAVYCQREYTVNNLRFAQAVEPTNVDIAAKLAWAISTIDAGKYTVPSTSACTPRLCDLQCPTDVRLYHGDVCARAVASELLTNPFMRVNTAPVRLYASTTGSLTLSAAPCDEDGVAVMGLIRQRKSAFGVGSGVKK